MYFKLLFFIAAGFISFHAFTQKVKEPIVMTIDGNSITKEEFLRVYLKNNEHPKYDQASLDEYMELFKNFKLKVAEAEALGYDTLPALVKELKGYDEQLAKPYLIDSSKTNDLVKEAYNRMKYEIRASHILIKVAPNASPADTLKAYNKAIELRNKILKGENFGDVAARFSEDPSAKDNKGDLGFFTVFQMVYPFESAAYSLKQGEISMPIRSSYGYHLIQSTDKRDARGTITAAHIMIAFTKNPERSEIEQAKAKIDEVYQKLKEGEPFEKLARLYSDDQGSKNSGGQLPAFGTGTTQRMIGVFEDAAFALKNDGDYSEPFQTDFGFHIVKRIEYKPLDSFENLQADILQKVKKGDRGKLSEEAFISNLKKANKFKDNSKKNLTWFYNNIDSTIFTKGWNAPTLSKNSWLFQYNKKKYDMQSFLDYLANGTYRNKMPIHSFVDYYYEQWQSQQIMNNEKGKLVEKYPSYKALLQEYHDGVLLYEIMKDKVWDKAIKDTTGLQEFYNKNISKYQWPQRVKAIIYSSDKKSMVEEANKLSAIDTLTMSDIKNQINTDSQLNIAAEEGKYIQNNNSILSSVTLKEGANEIFQSGDKYYFIMVEEIIPAGPKQLNEAKGEIIQDYQKYLEDSWLKELNQKHSVTINKDVLYSIGE